MSVGHDAATLVRHCTQVLLTASHQGAWDGQAAPAAQPPSAGPASTGPPSAIPASGAVPASWLPASPGPASTSVGPASAAVPASRGPPSVGRPASEGPASVIDPASDGPASATAPASGPPSREPPSDGPASAPPASSSPASVAPANPASAIAPASGCGELARPPHPQRASVAIKMTTERRRKWSMSPQGKIEPCCSYQGGSLLELSDRASAQSVVTGSAGSAATIWRCRPCWSSCSTARSGDS